MHHKYIDSTASFKMCPKIFEQGSVEGMSSFCGKCLQTLLGFYCNFVQIFWKMSFGRGAAGSHAAQALRIKNADNDNVIYGPQRP